MAQKKPNQWVIFLKDWASKNGKSYGCALSDPDAKLAYQQQKPTKATKTPKAPPLLKSPTKEEINAYHKENYAGALSGEKQEDYLAFMRDKLRKLDKIKYPENPIEDYNLVKIIKGHIKSLTDFAQSKMKLSKPNVEPKIKKIKPLVPLADALKKLKTQQTNTSKKNGKKIIVDNWTSKTLGFIFEEYDPETYAKVKTYLIAKIKKNADIDATKMKKFFKNYKNALTQYENVDLNNLFLTGIQTISQCIVNEISK